MKVTIIGGGHIGGACAFGFIKSGSVEVNVTARSQETLSKYQNSGIVATSDNVEAAKWADVVILAVKTSQMNGVLEQLKDVLKDKIVVSMAAQVTPEQFSGYAPYLIYAIPNTAAAFSNSVTFLSDISAGKDRMKIVKSIYDTIGICIEVDYKMLPSGISLASCGIGYAMKYMAAAVEGAVELGFSKDEAAKIVCQTVQGACMVVEAEGFKPEAEVKKVATPGGLTERGLNAMDKGGFTESVINGLKASL